MPTTRALRSGCPVVCTSASYLTPRPSAPTSLQRVPWAHSATPRSCYFVGDDEVAISLLYADPHPMPQLQVVQKTNQGDMSGPDTPTPLHSCTSSTFSDDSFDGTPQQLAKPVKPDTAAAMQRQTMHHVLSQLGGCPPTRTVQPRHGSHHASTSDEDDGRCSSAGEASPPASDGHAAHPRTLARAVSMPSTAAKVLRGPAWLHGNALSSKAMHAVLQQAVVAQHAPPIPKPCPAQPLQPIGWLDECVRLRPAPCCDMERLALAITPLLCGDTAPQHLSLRDVLRVFEAPSLHGMAVPTCHGSRGPSTAYYLPSLSAMRLLVAGEGSGVEREGEGMRWRLPSGDVVRVAAEAFEAEAPFARAPLDERVRAVLRGNGVDLDTPLAQLHPQSWLAVAWYPVYRIPDAPLTARFLALYSLAPQRAGPRHVMLPLAGLWWHNVLAGTPPGVTRERWLAMDGSQKDNEGDLVPPAMEGDVGTTVGTGPGQSSVEALSNLVYDTIIGAAATVLVNPYGGSGEDWSSVVERLQAAVPALARGVGVVGAEDAAPLPAPFYADYDFFASRRDLNAV